MHLNDTGLFTIYDPGDGGSRAVPLHSPCSNVTPLLMRSAATVRSDSHAGSDGHKRSPTAGRILSLL